MVVHRLKFKICELLEVYWIFAGFNKNFMGSVFLCHPAFSEIICMPHEKTKIISDKTFRKYSSDINHVSVFIEHNNSSKNKQNQT